MFDDEAVRIAREMLEADDAARAARFNRELGRIKSDAVKQGALGSSGYLFGVADLCANEVEAGTDRAWRLLYRTLTTTGVRFDAALSRGLKSAFDNNLLHLTCVHAEMTFNQARQSAQLPNDVSAAALNEFQCRVTGARRKVWAEIDLLSRSLERRPMMEKERASGDTIFNSYAPIGAVQTGPGASASVVQNLDAGARQEVIEALRSISEQIANERGLDPASVSEIREGIEEAQREVQKAAPNQSVLWSRLRIVAELVSAAKETAPTLRAVYEAFRAVLAAHGLT